MTRYARAKGSKASNQKLPEEATPWSELKKKHSLPGEEEPSENDQEIEEETNWKQKIEVEKKIEQNLNSTWCDFTENETKKKKKDKKRKKDVILEEELPKAKNDKDSLQELPKAKNDEDSLQTEVYKRRKIDLGDQVLDINGEEVTVTRFDGFYIRKEDADRIKELQREMSKRGVSKEEIRAAVKKERRNAEKSLARQKKKVCYHCRKGGHVLSECPKLTESKGSMVGGGICYKCGSTEHSHFQCKVSNSYKFATCFICREEGHISRECPDNPRGLYPKGGGCKLCGDVTHFRRDCPKVAGKGKQTLDFIQDDIEGLEEPAQTSSAQPQLKEQPRKNKVIKFK